MAICGMMLFAGGVRAEEASSGSGSTAGRSPCGAGACTKSSLAGECGGKQCSKASVALEEPCTCREAAHQVARGATGCEKAGKTCGVWDTTWGVCDKTCLLGATAITLDEGVTQASAISFNFLPEAPAPVDVALTPPQDLLSQKLAQRDQLQREIDELCETTQSWQQVVVHVKVMEVSLTKLRKLGIACPELGMKPLGAQRVSRAYTPACECSDGECSTQKCSFEASASHECDVEKCSADKCSSQKCSSEACATAKCSLGECTAGNCHGEKCSADGAVAEKCSTEKCSKEKCCSGQCAGEACADGVCYDAAVACETCPCECESQNLAAMLETLEANNVAKVLAAPTLVTVSGRPASFHVGGTLPIPAGPGSTSACDFMDFGASLDVLAVVLGANRVRLEVRPEISNVCHERSLEVAGGRIPAREVTCVDTACELEYGQSTVLTGLVQRRVEAVETEDGVHEQVNDVMLVVVVTPEAVESVARRASVVK